MRSRGAHQTGIAGILLPFGVALMPLTVAKHAEFRRGSQVYFTYLAEHSWYCRNWNLQNVFLLQTYFSALGDFNCHGVNQTRDFKFYEETTDACKKIMASSILVSAPNEKLDAFYL
jgi:hypothetical protein